jgi:hypothetical protein
MWVAASKVAIAESKTTFGASKMQCGASKSEFAASKLDLLQVIWHFRFSPRAKSRHSGLGFPLREGQHR